MVGFDEAMAKALNWAEFERFWRCFGRIVTGLFTGFLPHSLPALNGGVACFRESKTNVQKNV